MEPFDLSLWPEFKKAGGDAKATMIDQIAIDSRRIESPYALFVALHGAHQDGHHFVIHADKAGALYALVKKDWTPSFSLENIRLLRVDDPLQAFQEIVALFRQQLPAKIIAITGSYGKTMLKDLLHAILNTTNETMASPESFNSQIGVPLSLLSIRKKDKLAIIEAGISQKGEMGLLAKMIAPDYTILTNIGHAHINTLKDIATIASEKMKLLEQTPSSNWSLLPKEQVSGSGLRQKIHCWNEKNSELPHAEYLNSEMETKMVYKVTFPDGTDFEGVITSGFSYYLDLINIAVKAAWLLNTPSEAICTVLKNYVPEHMRTEIWKSPTGITFINNTYCSDPQSVEIALKHFEQTPALCRKVFVFGGMRPGINHSPTDYKCIGKAINKTTVDLLILYGNSDFTSLIDEISEYSPHTEINSCTNYQEAIRHMLTKLKHNDFVLVKGGKKEPIDTLVEAFNDSISNNQCLINLSAVQDNIEALRSRLTPKTRMMAIVKALAYGTDEIRMSKFLKTCGIDIVGVSNVEEGVSLKRSGVQQAIFVINAAPYEATKAVKWGLELSVSDQHFIESLALEALHQSKKIKVHLHVDTGMNRFGCRPENALALAKLIKSFPSLHLEGILTHFACADNVEEDAFTHGQIKTFERAIAEIKEHGIEIPWQHAANSSGVVRFNLPQFNMVRIGLAIYGLYTSEAVKKALELRLALSLTSRIVGINECRRGDTISYGRTYKVTKEKQRIAVLPIGYFDGIHRNYSGKGDVVIRGQRAPMVGKICMDYMMVDVTEISNVAVGDSVLIFGVDEHGQYLSPEELASKGNSIAHELVTCLGPRIQRVFVNE